MDNSLLQEMERFLRISIEANHWLTFADVNPVAIVEQISEQLRERRFEWIDGVIYAPNLLTVYVLDYKPDKMEEIEVLFNSIVFTKYLYDYIIECEYRLFDFIQIEIKAASKEQRELGGPCYLFFGWPDADNSLEQIAVKVDENTNKILEICEPRPEISKLARLVALNAEVYRNNYTIIRKVTYLGRLRNVIDKKTRQIIRCNDFVFARQQTHNSINASVSRQHGKIVFEDGEFFFYDTDSVNGSYLERNKNIIEFPSLKSLPQRIQLHSGDIICLGDAKVQFNILNSPDEFLLHPIVTGELKIQEIESDVALDTITVGSNKKQ